MKKIFFFIALAMSLRSLSAQTYGYNYQAVVRDGGGQVAANQSVQLRFQIQLENGQSLYEETHSTVADAFGRVARTVGAGLKTYGAFDTLKWTEKKHFLAAAIKIGGAVNWADIGREEIVLPPFTSKLSTDLWQLDGQNLYRLEGNIGIGLPNPDSKLEINGDLHLSGSRRIYFQGGPSDPNYFIESYIVPNCAAIRVKGYCGVTLSTAVGDILHIVEDRVGIGMGTSTPQAKLDVNGTTRTKILEITGGDVAEARHPAAKQQIQPGMVVIFDEKEQGKIRTTNRSYDPKVAGVISGAGKYFAGVCLLQEELAKGAFPLAQVGTVEVLCVGPVAVGDLLTTSSVPGYAMAVRKPLKGIGAAIGKATTTLKKGERGLVEIQVEKH